jgi:hypothetical protein
MLMVTKSLLWSDYHNSTSEKSGVFCRIKFCQFIEVFSENN